MNHDSEDLDGDDDLDAIDIAILGDKKRKSPIMNRIRTLVAALPFLIPEKFPLETGESIEMFEEEILYKTNEQEH